MAQVSRRKFLSQSAVGFTTTLGMGAFNQHTIAAGIINTDRGYDGEVLGQGAFRYRADRYWGQLSRNEYPVKDCHGIAEDCNGRILMLTNDTRNNLLAYNKSGEFLAAWEHRFPGAHGFEITQENGEDRYWIVDRDRQVLSLCTSAGDELRRLDPDVLKSKYPDMDKYHPSCVAILPDGDFFVSDGYGSSFIHHFDPDWKYISSFGGEGNAPENLKAPHAVWVDSRSGKPLLLVCDRSNKKLKWFSPAGELLRIVELPGALPCNIASFGKCFPSHLAIPCLNGMILILDGTDRVVSVIGGESPDYSNGTLQPLSSVNYTFNHPHDVCVDDMGALYVAQWWSNQSYPIKLELLDRMG